jgi:hypothetical protein
MDSLGIRQALFISGVVRMLGGLLFLRFRPHVVAARQAGEA